MRLPRFMLKMVRITGWVLLVLLAVQFSTVAAFEGLLPQGWRGSAGELHVRTGVVIGAVALLHVVAAVYLAVRRWTFKSRHPQT
ncbi:MAG: hypothetical protein MUP47_02600 [Phycisphaerae bacterium]|nr:hypothetical protein [Phycisphaerae bacterium]